MDKDAVFLQGRETSLATGKCFQNKFLLKNGVRGRNGFLHLSPILPKPEHGVSATVEHKNDPPRKETSSRFEKEKILNYIEKRSLPKFPWLQLSEGKLFCKVRNMLMIN